MIYMAGILAKIIDLQLSEMEYVAKWQAEKREKCMSKRKMQIECEKSRKKSEME